jgi:hypothetical protein
MLYGALFGVAFASQIVLLSIYHPRMLRRIGERFSQADPNVASLGTYAVLNNIIAVAGLGLLVAFFYFTTFDDMTTILLTIGLFFFLQLTPFVLPSVRSLWSALRSASHQPEAGAADQLQPPRLFGSHGHSPVENDDLHRRPVSLRDRDRLEFSRS